MTDETEHNSRSGIPLWVWAAILIPLLYFLSLGPVLFLFKHTSNPPDKALHVFYYPLVLLHDHTILRGAIEAYCDLWGV
jgi:hypothetical protein